MKRLDRIKLTAQAIILSDKKGLSLDEIARKLEQRFGLLASEESAAIKGIYEQLDVCAEVALVDHRPPSALVALLQDGCDGGLGEFEPFVPRSLARQGNTFVPCLRQDGAVEWCAVGALR